MKAVVLYDFEGDSGNGELRLTAGDEVAVLQTTIGDGWWEGTCKGKTGIFPASYVQVQDDAANWEDDFVSRNQGPGPSSSATAKTSRTASTGGTSQGSSGSTGAPPVDHAGKNINRFSPFVKSGAEEFVLATIKHPNAEHPYLGVNSALMWNPLNERIKISIVDPTKRSKFAGMKDVIEYGVSSPWGDVGRQFNHFEWLHDRLLEKFTFINFPDLPEKVLMGSTDGRFVEKRRRDLERYINRLARHPLIRGSEVFQHFVRPSDSKESWKAGKRTAEKDKVIGPKVYFYVRPEITLQNEGNNEGMKKFGKFARAMMRDLDFMLESTEYYRNSMLVMQKQSHRMGVATMRLVRGGDAKDPSSVNDLGHWDSRDGNPEFAALSTALVATSQALEAISKEWGAHHERCLNPFSEDLREYTLLLPPYQDTVEINNLALAKWKDTTKLDGKGRLKDDAMNAFNERFNVVYAGTNAEMNHVHDMRKEDFNRLFREFLQVQIDHHLRVVEILRGAVGQFQ